MHLFHLILTCLLFFLLYFFVSYFSIKKNKLITLSIICSVIALLQIFLPFGISFKIGGINLNIHLFIYPIIFIWASYFIANGLNVNKILYPIILTLVILISEIISFSFFFIVCKISINELNDFSSIYYFTDYYVLLFALLTVVFASFTNTCFLYQKQINNFYVFLLIGGIGLIILILSCVIIYFIIHYLFLNQHSFISYTLGFIVIIMITIICCIFLLKVSSRLVNSQKEIDELRQKQLSSVYNSIVGDAYEEMMKIRHDMGNILEISKNYNHEISNKLIDRVKSIDTTSICPHVLLNQILVIKLKEASKHNVKIDLVAEYPKEESTFEDTDLISLITNLFDNSLEATIMCENKYMIFHIKVTDVHICIHIKNNIPLDNASHSSTYIKKKHHGYGKKIINEIISKYHGHQEEYKSGNKYIIDISIPIIKNSTN